MTICKKITGWNNLTFITFADMITRIRDTAGRTKEQLIAQYMYWLRKRLNQSTLANQLFCSKIKRVREKKATTYF